ncbi:sn-glycerol-3-phosphate ABC transporter ATP-binding protein UgpC [uncultured Tateyamaria sp.]|uniref:ABC transporter ATP-binding protein n=1 Tax=uncultured Tateyamaria sp. TaxID=455651 RepID=UPI00261D9F1B|nr:sn-glycerol-3-phosphate ABC transporter ATP-binding protein UgpC [uncultured Tateyamaria sp.]
MAKVELQDVRKSFGTHEVIKGIDLEIPDGAFCVFVGPSGCGKSTLLRMIAGLEHTTAGTIMIGGKDVTIVQPAKRGVAMVFQSYALYPNMTVAENITFGLRMTNQSKATTEKKLSDAALILKLDRLLDRKPAQLSGGQRQRVAIGRAIVREPGVFLFDEPLSNLDAALRVEMRTEISRLHAELDSTMIYVTHDQIEAMTMADVIVVLNAGRIEQVGSPLELYHNPNSLFVAQFMGSPKMNTFAVELSDYGHRKTKVDLPNGGFIVVDGSERLSGPAVLGVRPEHITIDTKGELKGEVVLSERLGPETMLHVDVGETEPVIVKEDGLNKLSRGDQCALKIEADACHLFASEGQTIRSGSLLD